MISMQKVNIDLDGKSIMLMQLNGEDVKERLLKAGFVADSWEVYHAPTGFDLARLYKLTTDERF